MSVPAHIALAVAMALGLNTEPEVAEHVEQDAIRSILHPKQQEFFDCTARLRCVLGGRQGGKSFVIAAWLFDGAMERPGTMQTYLGLTQDACRESVWPEMLTLGEMIGLDPRAFNETTTTVKFPNGSRVRCKGTDDKRAIERRRGAKPYRIAIDEMGSQDESWVRYFVIDVMWPSLIKNDGQIALGGTPGLVLDGYWFGLTNDQREPGGAPVFKWTAWDNPGLGTPERVEAFIQEWLDSNKLDRDAPSFKREWLAEWAEDKGTLVYPFDKDRNGVEDVPETTPKGYPVPPQWYYAIGVDVGVVDKTAIVVTAANRALPDEYIVHAEEHDGALVAKVEQRIRMLKIIYPNARVVLDSGGMGKVHANEMTAWSSVAFEPAEKLEKASHTRLFRDRMLAGRIKVLMRPETAPLLKTWARLGWDKKRLCHEDGEDDIADACLYSWRALQHYSHDERRAKLPPRPGSPEEMEQWERESEEDEERAERRKGRREAWDA
jgi:hypothetical protein